ncbi:MAG: DNA polymerase III subunit gamma/tau [Candidatus Marinimicrobia bacterium]|nr:DNA polymerase III subunit gamma/tau [Candidatus Neomarinimicrobiota bacterium]|tara:strand:- start:39408 stop:41126 length:1719 start_codon:yes stop_codon:yes gene_type:complete
MTYKVLALKWRPNNFDQIIGQQHITKALKNAIKFNRISHAFTFSGPRGVGKTTTARILAKELNSVDDINSSFDIIEMDAASNRGIDEIRSLRENVSIAPAHGQYKIYIIDEVHMLTKEAFNALLKTLEEPPEHVVFILATTDAYKMPATILSRTQRYDFRRLSIDDIKKQLMIILQSENKNFNNDSLGLIARKADGSMRDALGYLDQVINYCEDSIDLNEIQNVLGVISDSSYLELFDAICNKDINNVIKIMNNSINVGGVSVINFISDFNIFLRQILYCMIGKKNSDNMIDVWIKNNKNIGELDVIRIMELLMKLENKIKFIDHPDLALELLMIKLCKLDNVIEISEIIKQLNHNDENINRLIDDSSNAIDKGAANDNVVSEQNNINKSIDGSNDAINSSIEDILDDNIKNTSDDNASDIVVSENNNLKNLNDKNIDNILDATHTDQQNDDKVKIDAIKINEKLNDIIDFIDDKNSKTAGFMGDIEILDVNDTDIKIKINNISKFLYDTLLKDIPLIKDAFNRCLNTDHNIIIIKGTEIPQNIDKEKKIKVDKEHPLFMDALEKFEGKIIK